MKKIISTVIVTALLLSSGFIGEVFNYQGMEIPSTISYGAYEKAPKYVFYFIGDGLGASQRQITEYYKQNIDSDNTEKLLINSLPISGINTTHSLDSLVTDSAAAGTALATGQKTNNAVISQTPDGKDIKTIIEYAEEKGIATGIVTSTRLTHATPAVFMSHNINRNNENEIAVDMLDSGVDYIAGGGYRHFVPKDWKWGKSKRSDETNVIQDFYKMGYKTFVTENDTKAFRDYEPKGKEKVIAALTYSHLPYEIDRKNTDSTPSLAELTQKGIDVLSKYDKGFFMMVEGGRIDHAAHANDPAGVINDVLAFDDAVKVAYDFYEKYPEETLIVVVGDHETGGLGLGFATNYLMNMDELKDLKISVEDTLQGKYIGDRNSYFSYIEKNLSLDNLNEKEKTQIEKAMDLVDSKIQDSDSIYGGYDPVAIATTHIVSERANIQWTTYAHTGTSIPLSSVGVSSERFSGYKDNTEIAKALMEVLNF